MSWRYVDFTCSLRCQVIVTTVCAGVYVDTYLRCGGVASNQIEKGLLLSLRVKFFLIGEYLAKFQVRT